MKFALVLSLLFVTVAFAADSSEESNELPLAKECDQEACKLPDCRCSSTSIPGGLAARDTPQFVTVTFDDAVNINNIITYQNVLYNRLNSNGCPAGATFYVSHEYTNYQAVNELYNHGFEIALHSITHQTPQDYWQKASYSDLKKELIDQRKQLSHFANISADAIKGIRLPFLQLSGNTSFQVMADNDISYDSSWPTITFTNPGLWPYTLDYASIQDCNVSPCPSASIPGPWVMPMVSWIDLLGFPCAMVDACFAFPDRENEAEWYQFILTNFERHYLGNRAPFGFYIHEAYLNAYPAVKNALIKFLDLVNNLHDAFMVNTHDVLEWVKNPVPIPEYRAKSCKTLIPTSCNPVTCGPLVGAHNNMHYWMTVCNTCPQVYPWLGNPLGH